MIYMRLAKVDEVFENFIAADISQSSGNCVCVVIQLPIYSVKFPFTPIPLHYPISKKETFCGAAKQKKY